MEIIKLKKILTKLEAKYEKEKSPIRKARILKKADSIN
ncbi:hypothetical protein LCGC14_0458720 [marine sediment metagenome]|uniref:Uncharacterized protein n=1 Tax=marine sediment metagenome TaxID=412755 RepID=A0A0F9SL01_9ZZZZ